MNADLTFSGFVRSFYLFEIETIFNKVSIKFQNELDFRPVSDYIFPGFAGTLSICCGRPDPMPSSPSIPPQVERNTHEPFAARSIVQLYV